MSVDEFKVVFTPSGRRGTFPRGTRLLDAARTLGVDIDSVCGGRGICGRCQVECTEGNFPKHQLMSAATHLSAFSETEQRYNDTRKTLARGRRLSCQTLLEGDVLIDVPAESQVHRQVVRKEAEHRDIALDTSVHLYYLPVVEPDMHDPSGDLERLFDALEREWQLSDLAINPGILAGLQGALRDGKWFVTVAVYRRREIIAIWPGYQERALGLAVDVGSTTVAAHLCDLVTGDVLATGSMMNPQIRFGEDLMSRVSHLMMHPEAATELTEVIREALNQLLVQVTAEVDARPQDVLDMTLVANPVMHHIFLGINPIELGGAPFALATDAALNVHGRDLGLHLHPGARVYVLPCIAGHVGADTAGVILSEEPWALNEISLLVDVGTNAEIVLGNGDRLLACSSPTGPAFEGAQIGAGQRAAAGAIERVRIDAETLEPRVKVIGCDLWSDEEGFAEQTAAFGVTGICGSGIVEVMAQMYLAGIISEDGVIDGSLAGRCKRIVADDRTWSYLLYGGEQSIQITQNDVRQIQLAKAALYAGVKLLMDHLGVSAVDRIRLAGAFGSHIDVRQAMVIGLIPDCELSQVSSAGNAAGTGARIALLNLEARSTIERQVKHIGKVETAVEARFQEYFVHAMAFPNKTDDFPLLFNEVQRPPRKSLEPNDREGARGRRRRKKRA